MPHYKLPRLHEELVRRGVLVRAEVRPLRETFGRVFAERSRVPSAA
ncbi:MAG: hypothetical protein L6Q72_03720 [Burkholderiaceae bacterium]|nr:hypothetical protein [Burkholderiaceae bacterium]